MIAAALLGSLSDRARAGRIHAVTEFGSVDSPSTKGAVTLLANLTNGPRVLVIVERDETAAMKSVRNILGVHTITVGQLNAYDVLHADDLVFSKTALEAFIASKTKKEVSA
jgi:large subunit ribosomal protein L4